MTDTIANYLDIAHFYEACLDKHGATPQGVDWPNQADNEKRFEVMLNLMCREAKNATISLLDLGCGYGAMADYLIKNKKSANILYNGIDISPKMIGKATELFPDQSFSTRDILQNPLPVESVDYVIMNGVLTEKRSLTWDEMKNFAQRIIKAAFDTCRKGIAFNVMSQQVDWCGLQLFHWSFDEVAAFLFKSCSRHVVFRSDYGLYEYTVYAYKVPNEK